MICDNILFISVCFAFIGGSLSASTNMSNYKVLVANPSVPESALQLLKNKCEVIINPDYERSTILKNISGVHGLFWVGGKLDKEILDAAGPQLKVVGTMSAGYNHIDTQELKTRGIKLGNTPKVLDDAVAEVALLLALAASRRFTEGRRHIEQETWINYFDTQWMIGPDIAGSTVGIVGLGGIGQAIAKRLKAFEVNRILYSGHREKAEGKQLGAKFVDLDTLNKESDFIFLSAPLTNETRQMCNEQFFAKMKKSGILINVARGELVDQCALVKALKENRIFAAGLDVMTPEPLTKDSELLKLSNVVLTPHIGSATIATRRAMAELTAQNILRGLGDAELFTPVEL